MLTFLWQVRNCSCFLVELFKSPFCPWLLHILHRSDSQTPWLFRTSSLLEYPFPKLKQIGRPTRKLPMGRGAPNIQLVAFQGAPCRYGLCVASARSSALLPSLFNLRTAQTYCQPTASSSEPASSTVLWRAGVGLRASRFEKSASIETYRDHTSIHIRQPVNSAPAPL